MKDAIYRNEIRRSGGTTAGRFLRYIFALWHHQHSDEPVRLYSEIDDARREIRKVHVFPDGHSERASGHLEGRSTFLAEKAIPTLAEINSQSDFEAAEIDAVEFEAIWKAAENSR